MVTVTVGPYESLRENPEPRGQALSGWGEAPLDVHLHLTHPFRTGVFRRGRSKSSVGSRVGCSRPDWFQVVDLFGGFFTVCGWVGEGDLVGQVAVSVQFERDAVAVAWVSAEHDLAVCGFHTGTLPGLRPSPTSHAVVG